MLAQPQKEWGRGQCKEVEEGDGVLACRRAGRISGWNLLSLTLQGSAVCSVITWLYVIQHVLSKCHYCPPSD